MAFEKRNAKFTNEFANKNKFEFRKFRILLVEVHKFTSPIHIYTLEIETTFFANCKSHTNKFAIKIKSLVQHCKFCKFPQTTLQQNKELQTKQVQNTND